MGAGRQEGQLLQQVDCWCPENESLSLMLITKQLVGTCVNPGGINQDNVKPSAFAPNSLLFLGMCNSQIPQDLLFRMEKLRGFGSSALTPPYKGTTRELQIINHKTAHKQRESFSQKKYTFTFFQTKWWIFLNGDVLQRWIQNREKPSVSLRRKLSKGVLSINAIRKDPWHESPKFYLNFVRLNVPPSWDVLWSYLVKPHSFVVIEQDKAWWGCWLWAGDSSSQSKNKEMVPQKILWCFGKSKVSILENAGVGSRKTPNFCHFSEVLDDL